MCRLDISSLCTNIPVAEVINLILNFIYTNAKLIYKGISRENFRKLLQLVLNNTYFKFNGKIYKQKEGLAITLADRRKYFSKLIRNKVSCRTSG